MSDAGGNGPKRPGLTAEQQALVLQALPKVEQLVQDVARGREEKIDDIRSAAHEALSRKARTYNPAKNNCFDAYWWRSVYSAAVAAANGGRKRARRVSPSGMRAGLEATVSLRDETNVYFGTEDEFERHLLDSGDETAFAYCLGVIGAAGEEGLILRAERARRMAALHAEVAALPPDDRRLAELRLFERRPAREVAALLGISKSTVDRRCRALRERLREALEARDIDRVSTPAGRGPADARP